jgi:hypothetical protein
MLTAAENKNLYKRPKGTADASATGVAVNSWGFQQ